MSGATAASPGPDHLPPRGRRAAGFAANLARRVGTALVVLPALLAAFLLGPPALAVAIVAAALSLGLVEFFGLLQVRGIRPMNRVGALLAAALFLDVVWPGWHPAPFLPLGALLLLTFALWRGANRDSVGEAAGTLLVADTAAFFVGHAFGRRRLAPAVSPGKSVEGALASLVGGVAGALAVRAVGLPHLPLAHAVLLGAAVAVMGVVGDLDESLLKRWAGVKDSGRLFPGHGGMLDRLDSLLFGAPVLYYYFLYLR